VAHAAKQKPEKPVPLILHDTYIKYRVARGIMMIIWGRHFQNLLVVILPPILVCLLAVFRLPSGHGQTQIPDGEIAAPSLAWSPNGNWIAVSGVPGIRLYTSNLQLVTALTNDVITSIAWSPDSRSLASTGRDKAVKIWNVASRSVTHTLHGHTKTVMSVAWNPTGKLIASGGADNTIRIWNASIGASTVTITTPQNIRVVAWSPDGTKIAGAGGDAQHASGIQVWNASTGTLIRNLQDSEMLRPVTALAWSPDSAKLASVSYRATVWNVSAGTESIRYLNQFSSINSLSWSFSGNKIVSASNDPSLDVWDPNTGNTIVSFPNPGIVSFVVWHPNGSKVAVIAVNASMSILDATTGNKLASAFLSETTPPTPTSVPTPTLTTPQQ
jgi:WD40 repeat protein